MRCTVNRLGFHYALFNDFFFLSNKFKSGGRSKAVAGDTDVVGEGEGEGCKEGSGGVTE